MLWKNRIISIDIETTGLDATEDEIVQISIVNGRGKTLYNSYIRPEDGRAWDRGMGSRKAAWQAVRNAPALRHERRKIERILRRADLIVGYNHKAFDMPFLAAKGINTAVKARLYDVMLEFAYIAGEYSDEYGDYCWKPLTYCAWYYGYTDYKPHDANEDALAALYCYYAIQRDRKGRRTAEKRKRSLRAG